MSDILQNIKVVVTVTDSAGTALVGASVSLSPVASGSTGKTVSDGTCTLIVPYGTYTAGASMTGFVTASGVAISDGNATCTLNTVTGNGIIKATATGTASANLAGAKVTATPSSGTTVTGTTNSSGVAAISAVAKSYSVVASMSGYSDSSSQTALVTSGGSVSLSLGLTKND